MAASIKGTASWVHWDEPSGTLVLSADRIGLTPLYSALRSDGSVVVADSAREAAALLSGPMRPDAAALVAHLCGLPAPDGQSCYEGVRAILPGIVVTLTSDRSRVEVYWRPRLEPPLAFEGDADYARAYRALLTRIVSEYAGAGVATALTLSGGLDSTSIAAVLLAADPRPEAVAVSLSAPELPSADETPWIRAVAAFLGLDPIWIRFDEHWPLRAFERDGPAPDSAFCLPYDGAWRAMNAAARSRGARVMLAGHGGDELLGGNVFPYVDLLAARRWRDFVSNLTAHLRGRRPGVTMTSSLRDLLLRPLVRSVVPGWPSRDWPGPPAWLTPRARGIWRDSVRGAPSVPRGSAARRQRLVRVLRGDMARTGEHHVRVAASYGLDLRLPLLDHEIVEFALSLPPDQAVRGGVRKWIVRQAMRGRLPEAVLDRTDKTYPTAVAERGLKQREVERVWSYLTDMRTADLGLVDERRAREAYRAYLNGTTRSSLFWHTITLEHWLRTYFA
jgi:asparagine synthase (glutamine-hydrolysing)